MTKSELINKIYEDLNENGSNLHSREVEKVVKALVDTIARSLAKGRRVEIRGFGGFNLNYRPKRIGRNPKNGNKVNIDAKYVPHFKAGKELRERVNNYSN